jgi:hypothetical protein
VGGLAAVAVVGPGPGQIEVTVDEGVSPAGGIGGEYADLAIFGASGGAGVLALYSGGGGPLLDEDDGAYLMLVPAQRPDDDLGAADAAERLAPLLAGGWAALATGSPAAGAAGLRRSIEEARHSHRVAALGTGTVRTEGSAALSSHQLLLAAVPEDVRRLYRDRLIGVVERYDAEHGSDLVGTLAAFLDASGSWQRCAEQLHVHVNTLRYRLQRVEQLTGHSLATLRDRTDFLLALGIRGPARSAVTRPT